MNQNASTVRSEVLLKVKTHSFSVSIDTFTIYSFDREGRLIGAYLDHTNYKRGLDNSILRKWSGWRNGVRRRYRTKLSTPERQALFAKIMGHLRDISEHPEEYALSIPEDADEAWNWLGRCLAKDYQALERDAERFHEIYKPVTILPPDQYYSLVLQITEGCSYNKCTFCKFYQDRRFRIKSPDELRNHIEGVNAFFGSSLGLRQSIFLADANALIMPQARLVEMLHIIRDSYQLLPDPDQKKEVMRRRRSGEAVFDGIYSFIDLFTGEYKSAADFEQMASLGVNRVYIGMESGSKPLLDFLNKPGSKSALITAVNKVKAGGIRVGVIVLLGAGGKEYSQEHISESADVLNQMNLTAGDFIYFSDFYPQQGTRYAALAEQEAITGMSYEEIRKQESDIRDRLIY
ncbi:MAG TPA: radical SAM protein, partial [bacterium]|nr:radical SAM protein [bacterium]